MDFGVSQINNRRNDIHLSYKIMSLKYQSNCGNTPLSYIVNPVESYGTLCDNSTLNYLIYPFFSITIRSSIISGHLTPKLAYNLFFIADATTLFTKTTAILCFLANFLK
jgi:hypothetical protein